ncbi:SDR family NAD(P)-dependent oxidoreductase [Streptomyces massasporeus]|uniref:SDR family NAD(P)-dependent oxidoreductase n=1 Tax=Streptomyces massasporeus TaxID=67324 RepID=UPI0033EF13A9
MASHFRREGANLMLTGRRPELAESDPDDVYLPGDLNDEALVSELAAGAADHFGDVGVVVLCHGPNQTLYSAAKGGLIALARGAAIEWAPRGIRVNVVAPGLTMTPIIEASFQRRPDPAAYRRVRGDSIPLRRLATPEEVADAVLLLACPESSYVTGAVLPVDGGYTAF